MYQSPESAKTVRPKSDDETEPALMFESPLLLLEPDEVEDPTLAAISTRLARALLPNPPELSK